MSIDWNIILWCCITNVVLIAGFVLVYYIASSRAVKKRREDVKGTIESIAPGREILFSGGIKGTIVNVEQDFVDVRVADNVIVTIAYYSINQVLEKKHKVSKEKIAKKKAEK